MIIEVKSEDEMKQLGYKLGLMADGGQVIELIGDVGAGKTTLTKGIASGMGVADEVQSPSYTINRVYETARGFRLSHYDFYRLHEAGIMTSDVDEAIHDSSMVTVIEWAAVVSDILPDKRLTIEITVLDEFSRQLHLRATGKQSLELTGALQ